MGEEEFSEIAVEREAMDAVSSRVNQHRAASVKHVAGSHLFRARPKEFELGFAAGSVLAPEYSEDRAKSAGGVRVGGAIEGIRAEHMLDIFDI